MRESEQSAVAKELLQDQSDDLNDDIGYENTLHGFLVCAPIEGAIPNDVYHCRDGEYPESVLEDEYHAEFLLCLNLIGN